MSAFVSPGGVKMGRFLITGEKCKSYRMRLIVTLCVLLMTWANLCKSGVLALGNPCSVR